MLDFAGEVKMVTRDSKKNSLQKLSLASDKLKKQVASPQLSPSSSPATASCRLAYGQYLRLPELRRVWSSTEFSEWKGESIIKPALQALEITFRFISVVLLDPRQYTNCREWQRRLESLAKNQISIIALLCEDDDGRMEAPTADPSSSVAVCRREGSALEVWKPSGETTVVSHGSNDSLLPRLASWHKSEAIAQRILECVELEMSRCSFTLGLGEANLAGKANLCYDAVCKPSELHFLKQNPCDGVKICNFENQTLYTTIQLLETWIYASKQLLLRIKRRIDEKNEQKACDDCWLMEKMWKLLGQIEDLHLVMDPDDFLRLKNQLGVKSEMESDAFCLRSEGLMEITKMSKEMKQKVPWILEVEVDPKGGPRVQEAAMKMYMEKREGEKIHLLQAMQGVEGAMKRFYFGFREVVMSVMGSVEVRGGKDGNGGAWDLFMEPAYFPSLDAAKTFLADYWGRHHHHGGSRSIRARNAVDDSCNF